MAFQQQHKTLGFDSLSVFAVGEKYIDLFDLVNAAFYGVTLQKKRLSTMVDLSLDFHIFQHHS